MLEVRSWEMPLANQYPHAYPEKWVDQQYLPDKLLHADYFTANDTGKYERALGMTQEKIKNLKKK